MLQVASGVGLYAERLAVALGFVTLYGSRGNFRDVPELPFFPGSFGFEEPDREEMVPSNL